jgi:uncharacterized membrane protein
MTVREANIDTSGSRRFFINLWSVSLLLVFIGIGISGYLSYVIFADVPMVCTTDGPFECDVVQNSVYARVSGVPVAYLGLFSYLFIGALLLLEDRTAFLRENAILLLFIVILLSWLYSMYLVYVQGVILQAWCIWCLMHEINITILFALTSIRLWRDLSRPA